MTTYLVALHFSRDIQADLDRLSEAVLPADAVRCLPPLVPISWHAEMPSPATLDRIRKAHPLEIRFSSVRVVDWNGVIGVAVPDSDRRQYDRLREAVAAGASGGNPLFDPLFAIACCFTAVRGGHQKEIEKDVTAEWHQLSTARSTGALWLTAIEIETFADRWYESVSWRMVYSRRLTSWRE